MIDLESIEAAAWRDLYDAAPSDVKRTLRLEQHRIDGATVLRARLPVALFNRILDIPVVTDTILASVAPGMYLQLRPQLIDGTTCDRLEARGLFERTRWVKMHRPAESGLPSTSATSATSALTIVLAEKALATVYGETFAAGYELPPQLAPWNAALVDRPGWRCYIAFDGDVPIATAALFSRGAVARLGAAGTRPGYRNRGAQTALIARRIDDAATLGVTDLVTETGMPAPGTKNPSLDNLIRAGFVTAYERANFGCAD